jgi:VanZ family protein
MRLTHPAVLWLGYISFVVYGSLVPLDFHPLPLDQAWATFKQLRMYQLSIEQRADWVANGVLFVPVGFLTVALFGENRTRLARLPLLVGCSLFCFALALALEFTQLFFPQRTVSRNDVIAEAVGSVLGIICAVYWSGWFRKVLAALAGNLGQLKTRVLQAYVIGYLAFSLFPFDFLVSMTELAAKADSDAWDWFLSPQNTSRGLVILTAKLLAEVLAVMPIGILVGYSNERRRQPATRQALTYGILLGLAIEAAQFFIFSGISQGASLLTRALGMYCGALLWRDRILLSNLQGDAANTRLTFPLALLYLLGLISVNGWFQHSWRGLAFAGRTLAETRFLPFYYHYFTTEQAALLSLASVALMYAPVGLLAWLRWWSPAAAFWAAAITATGIEVSKLFLAELHPDPTNLLIGALAAWSVVKLLQHFQEASAQAAVATTSQATAEPAVHTVVSASSSQIQPTRTRLALAVTLGLTAWIVVDFPFHPLLLALLLLSYGSLLWFQPHWLWAVIPAALPLLDLAPWSGRLFLDEFDFLIIVSLLIGYARTRPAPRASYRDVIGFAVACLLALTFAISTAGGMLPLALPDANSFNNYYSPYNALRIAKGSLWALLLFVLMHRFTARGRDIRPLFAAGMVVGLAGTVAVVIWERAVFPGLFNFADIYRVTGPFSHMRTGAADLETFLTAAMPFAVILTVQGRSITAPLAGGLLVLGSTYALGVTFSRAGYAGYALAFIIACLAAWLSRTARTAADPGRDSASAPAKVGRIPEGGSARSMVYRWAAPLVLFGLAAMVALPIYSGPFAQERIATIGKDLATRQAHWADALAMRDPGLVTALFGMGIGRFPETHYWRSTEPRATSYRLESEAGNTFLRLGTGGSMYLEQLVVIEPGHEYVLHVDIRSPDAEAGIAVFLCEKLLLTSGRCVSSSADVTQGGGKWQRHQLRLPSGDIGSGIWLAQPPVKLSFSNSSRSRIDVDNVRLLTAEGQQLSHNGDFERSLDRWLFSVDEHLAWHIKSMPVAILFDQGWFGILAFGVLLALGVRRTARQALTGDSLAGACFASLTGVLVITTLNTVIDAPRFLLLLLLLTWLGWAGKSHQRHHA